MNDFINDVLNTFNYANVEKALAVIESLVGVNPRNYSQQELMLIRLAGVSRIISSDKFNYSDKKKVADYLRKIADDLDPILIQ